MSERRVSREGIHIDREVADAVAIEEELDSNVVGPYRFPDPQRRRTSALIYLATAVLVAVIIDPLAALIPLGLAIWHWFAAWPLEVEQEAALAQAATAVDFAIGHASAAVAFKGLRARPEWSVIVYSAAEPPDRRALVTIDGVDGTVLGDPYVESI
ncbi:MAG TPA: hypothetical protein VK088_04950 [Acidimicrobiia bacterium]|nr:hypothetical protein [Acidimicrobiia bacterium]